jgi:hypothetical protein
MLELHSPCALQAAKKYADTFYPESGGCPIGLQVWLHKENDESEDMMGPVVVTRCNPDDENLFYIEVKQSTRLSGRSDSFKLEFHVKDLLYIAGYASSFHLDNHVDV